MYVIGTRGPHALRNGAELIGFTSPKPELHNTTINLKEPVGGGGGGATTSQ
jgi:hypothetical protein